MPRFTFSVQIRSNVPFSGGEAALGFDPAVLKLVAVRTGEGARRDAEMF